MTTAMPKADSLTREKLEAELAIKSKGSEYLGAPSKDNEWGPGVVIQDQADWNPTLNANAVGRKADGAT